jgi:hypothetical protein
VTVFALLEIHGQLFEVCRARVMLVTQVWIWFSAVITAGQMLTSSDPDAQASQLRATVCVGQMRLSERTSAVGPVPHTVL